jgi:RNA polymerase sigma factor (sigma-70 family)
VTTERPIEDLLRTLAPQVLGSLVRRCGDFADAEDAAQEALIAASTQWPAQGVPDNPRGWLIQVGVRRLADQLRSDDARRRREDLAAAHEPPDPDPASGHDDALVLMFMCCDPSLTPASAIALTLRAVGGLTTAEIARAFLVPETTMAQRISRAKQRIAGAAVPFALPTTEERADRLRAVLHVLYLIFNEGYTASAGPALARTDLSGEAIRLARAVHAAVPDDAEVAGLLALMLLTDARRPARADRAGGLVPLAEQDRSRWDTALIAEGTALVTAAITRGRIGEYQLQAAIAAVHDQARTYEETDWLDILGLYGVLERVTGNPMARLNRAVALAMTEGPEAGLALIEDLDDRLAQSHRLAAVRAHLLEMAGDHGAAIEQYRRAAAATSSLPEQRYLVAQASRLRGSTSPASPHGP